MLPTHPFHNSQTYSMSFADATLMIGYSSPEYNAIFVKSTFDTIFGVGFVEQVREIVITPEDRPKYKKFYIYTFDDEHPAMLSITDLINDYKFAAIVYNIQLDPMKGEYVHSFWKVTLAPMWKTFTPYLMIESQMRETDFSIAPWSVEANVAFEPAAPMVRDNEELKGPPKLVRSTNTLPTQEEIERDVVNEEEYWMEYSKTHDPPPLVRSRQDDEDISNDFDDLAAAVAQFGEDYSGCIAPKIPRPPLD